MNFSQPTAAPHPLKAVSHSPSPFPPAAVDPALNGRSSTQPLPIASTNGGSAVSMLGSSATLQGDDAHKLAVVLASLASDEALLERVAPGGSQSVKAMLTAPNTTLGQMSAAISQLELPSADERWRSIALALLVELDTRYKQSQPAAKRPLESSPASPQKKRYMLHRGLNNLDLFSAPAELTDEEAAQLAALDDTDLVALQPQLDLTPSTSKAVPQLAQVMPPPSTRARRAPPVPSQPQPVELLYYDPFSSFAPTHDSAGATLTHSQTLASALSRARMRRWQAVVRKPLTKDELASALPAPKEEPDEDAQMEDGVRSKENEEERTWAELGQNALRIGQLVREQWARLDGAQEGTAPKAGPGAKPLPVGAAEQATAALLIRSLSRLISSVAPSSPSRTEIPLVPKEAVRSSSPVLLSALRPKRAPKSGLLDPNNFRAIKESALTRKIIHVPPPAPQPTPAPTQHSLASSTTVPQAEANLIPKLEE